MTEILLLFLLGLVVLFWYESLRLREHVIRHCQQECRESGLQLLDQTVALVAVSLRRGADGMPHIRRTYQFEVSEDGADRYPGYVEVLGRVIVSLRLAWPEQSNLFIQRHKPTLH